MTKSLTPSKAIRKKCRECVGNHLKEIRECSVKECPLFSYRMGKRPRKRGSIERIRNSIDSKKDDL
jgi:hypothetical protein